MDKPIRLCLILSGQRASARCQWAKADSELKPTVY